MECTKCHSLSTKYLKTFVRRNKVKATEYKCLDCGHIFIPKKNKSMKHSKPVQPVVIDECDVNHLSKLLNVNHNKLTQWLN